MVLRRFLFDIMRACLSLNDVDLKLWPSVYTVISWNLEPSGNPGFAVYKFGWTRLGFPNVTLLLDFKLWQHNLKLEPSTLVTLASLNESSSIFSFLLVESSKHAFLDVQSS
jgi:hypothetical protein